MNIRTIKDLMIDAVRLDRETHEHVGPARLRAQQIAYAHDFSDMAGWGKVPGDRKCQLEREDADPHRALRQAFWEQYAREPSPQEIARADKVNGWIMLVDKPEERRALLGWLKSKAGGKAFRRWCLQVEGISQTTGLKRKNRALEKIFLAIHGSGALHGALALPGGLPSEPEIGDLEATIAAGADEIEGLNNWAAPDAKPDIEVRYESSRSGDRAVTAPASDFTWAMKQNARRRQREAAKAKKQAQAEKLSSEK